MLGQGHQAVRSRSRWVRPHPRPPGLLARRDGSAERRSRSSRSRTAGTGRAKPWLVQAKEASTRPALSATAHQPRAECSTRVETMTQPTAIAKLPIAIQALANPRLPTSKAYTARPGSMSAARFIAATQLTSSTRYAVRISPEAVAAIDRQGGLPSARTSSSPNPTTNQSRTRRGQHQSGAGEAPPARVASVDQEGVRLPGRSGESLLALRRDRDDRVKISTNATSPAMPVERDSLRHGSERTSAVEWSRWAVRSWSTRSGGQAGVLDGVRA